MTASIRVRAFCLEAFRRNQDHFPVIRLINIPEGRDLFVKRILYVLFFTASAEAKESENPTQQTHRNSRLTSWNSTRFIGSTQTTHAHVRSLLYTRSLKLHRRIRAGSMTQEPNSWHSLAPLGYPSDLKNHREPFLLPGASCPHPVFAHSRPLLRFPISSPFFRLLVVRCISFFSNAKGPSRTGNQTARFKKNGKSLRACQSDVRGFAPIWLMMIHCFISRTSAILLSVGLTRPDENKRDCHDGTLYRGTLNR